jgi:hypothetical protein
MLRHSHFEIALSRFSDVALKCFEKFFDAHCFGYSRLLIRKRGKSTYAVGSTFRICRFSGHESKKSLEIYQHLSLGAVEQAYQEAVHGDSI